MSGLANDYIFPIIQPGLNTLQQLDLLHDVRKLVNKGMAAISKPLGIEKKVTTNVTRHSFPTQLKRAGVSTEYIQEALGHTNIRTTETYLDSFDRETKMELASKLTTAKNEHVVDKGA